MTTYYHTQQPHPHKDSSIYQQKQGMTPLMLACQQGCYEDVEKILQNSQHATEKEKTRGGKTCLHFCAENGSTNCLDLLLKKIKMGLNPQDDEGHTPLHLAVINGNKDIVRKLINVGADLECLDNERHSLVHWAAVCGELQILEILLSHKAPASTPDIHLAHPIHYAAQMCGSHSSSHKTPTVYGVNPKKGLQILKRLIHAGCPIDVRDQDGRVPLLWAACAGSSDAILQLINAGAKVDAEDKDGLTALHCASSRNHTSTLETLISLCGAEPDTIDNNGCTALFYAVTLGHADCTELLLNYGSEPNRQDRKGRTPAHCGAAKGQLETLKLLSRHGGNLWLRNVRGDLPLHEAVLSGRRDLVSWLLSQRPETVNSCNNDGRSLMHLAAISGSVEMVKVLVDFNGDVNLLMRGNRAVVMTPLDAAVLKGKNSVGKFLQMNGGLPFNCLGGLQRRLNRSVEGGGSSMSQVVEGGSSGGGCSGRIFVSPDVFNNSSGPFASTPIDFSNIRDVEVQVGEEGSDGGVVLLGSSFEENKGEEFSEGEEEVVVVVEEAVKEAEESISGLHKEEVEEQEPTTTITSGSNKEEEPEEYNRQEQEPTTTTSGSNKAEEQEPTSSSNKATKKEEQQEPSTTTTSGSQTKAEEPPTTTTSGSNKATKEEQEEQLETGNSINLQEAARRRSQTLSIKKPRPPYKIKPSKPPLKGLKPPTKKSSSSEEREIIVQDAILASKKDRKSIMTNDQKKHERQSIFSSLPKQYRMKSDDSRTASVTSDDSPRRSLTFSRNDYVSKGVTKKVVDVDTNISVTQAMQASMRKYNLERTIFHELLELKRIQLKSSKANEQLLVKRIADNYKKSGYSVNFRDYDGPFTFKLFEKYLYDQLRLLQNNKRLLPRFAPSDDINKLSTALKKMNLPEENRSESGCDNIQCTHTTHRCHHAAHAYTGVPCAAYITRKSFLPPVNPLKAPGPTQKENMHISISPRTDSQSPITLEVQQGDNTQVFTLPTRSLDPSKNYYVSLSIKPNPIEDDNGREGCVSAPPGDNGGLFDDHNISM